MLRRGLIVLEHRDGDEFSGIKRVFEVLGRIESDTLQKIHSAHDHKGTLHLTWAEDPDEMDMSRVESAWADVSEFLLEYALPNGHEYSVHTGVTNRERVR